MNKGTQTTLDHYQLYKEYRDKWDELLEDYDILKTSVVKLERKLQKSRFKEGSRATHIQRLEETISGCRFEISALELTNQRFQATISKLDLEKARMDVQTDLKERIQQLENKLEKKEKHSEWQNDEIEELKTRNDNLTKELALEKEKRTTSQDLTDANQENLNLFGQLKYQDDALETVEKEKAELEEKLKRQQAQTAKVQSSLVFRNAEYERQEQVLLDAQKAIEDQETKLAMERQKVETAQRERDVAKRDFAVQQRLVQDASADSTGIKENLNECQTQLGSARSKIEALESSLEVAKREYAKVVDEKAAIMVEVSKLRADNSEFNADPARFFNMKEDVSRDEEARSTRSESPSVEHGIPGYNSAGYDSSEDSESESGHDARTRREMDEEFERLAAENAALRTKEGELEKVDKGTEVIRHVERILLVDLHASNALKCWFSTDIDMLWLILQALWLVKIYDIFFLSTQVIADDYFSTGRALGGAEVTGYSDGEVAVENESTGTGTGDLGTQNGTQGDSQTEDTVNFDAQGPTHPSPIFTETIEPEKLTPGIPSPTSTPSNLQLPKNKRAPGDRTSPFTGRVPSIKWTTINFLLHLVVYMYIFSSYVERSLWLAANEETRSFYIDWFTPRADRGYMLYPFHDSVLHLEPWFTRADIWVYWHIVEPFWSFFQYDGVYVLPG